MPGPTTVYRSCSDDPTAQALIARLVAGWEAGRPPDLRDLIPAAAAGTVVADVACQELDLRFAAGSVARAADYLDRFPRLAEADDLVLYLLEAEVLARKRYGPPPQVEEYAERFPQFLRLVGRLIAPPADDPPAAAGEFRLGERLGEGGMGVVYRAHDPVFHRPLAVKVMKVGQSAARFLAEADLTARLQHPGIPPVHTRGELADGRPFLAMKLVEGDTLHALLARRLTPADELGRFLGVFEGVCQAVGYAHSEGVIHRDLKPGNVMVGRFGEVQVMDWGLAKVLTAPTRGAAADPPARPPAAGPTADTDAATRGRTDSATPDATRGAVGTYAYMPPEQAGGGAGGVDRRADVFGLGGILCHILTGRPPYSGGDPAGLARRADLADALGRLRGCGADPDLIRLAERCLAPAPADRPADGTAVADLIAEYRTTTEGRLRAAEVAKGQAEVEAREQRKRRRTQARAAVAVAVLLAAGGGFGWWADHRAGRERERRTAEEAHRKQAELDLAEQRLARQVENHQAVIRLAMQRGEDQTAIDAFDRAVADGLPVTPEMRLTKARALAHLMKASAAQRELSELDGPDLPPGVRARADLLAGSLLLGTADEPRGEDLVRRAVAAADALPPAEREYALGLVAPTAPAALARFEEAVRLDPRHTEARGMACITLFTLGRLDDAIRLAGESLLVAPRQVTFPFLLAAAHAVAGDRPAAARAMTLVRPGVTDPHDLALLEGMVNLLPDLRATFRAAAGAGPPVDSAKVTEFMHQHLPKLAERIRRPGGDGLFWGLRAPRAVRRGLTLVLVELNGLVVRQGGGPVPLPPGLLGDAKPVLWFADAAGEAVARRRLAEHPEGMLALVFAFTKMGQGLRAMEGGAADRRERLADAAAALEQAARTPGLFGTESSARDLAILYYVYAGFDRPGEPARPAYAGRAAELVHLRRRMPDAVPAHVRAVHFYAARDARQFGLAHLLLDEWRRDFPNDPAHELSQVWLDFLTGHHERALAGAEAILGKERAGGRPAGRDLWSLLDRCRERLGKPELLPAPRAGG